MLFRVVVDSHLSSCAEQADKHRRAIKYKIGDTVLLSTANLSTHNSKLRSRYIGPFPIVKVWSDVVMELELPIVMNRHFKKFHISKLRFWKENSERFPSRRQINRPTAEVIDGDNQEWEVERILGERELRNKDVQYLVLWKGYPVEDATWEPADFLHNSQNIITTYKAERDGAEAIFADENVEEVEIELEEEIVEEEKKQDLEIGEEKDEAEDDWQIAGNVRRSSRIRARR
jgi:Chromo (CHRromatin Organisation MOdifier) domain